MVGGRWYSRSQQVVRSVSCSCSVVGQAGPGCKLQQRDREGQDRTEGSTRKNMQAGREASCFQQRVTQQHTGGSASQKITNQATAQNGHANPSPKTLQQQARTKRTATPHEPSSGTQKTKSCKCQGGTTNAGVLKGGEQERPPTPKHVPQNTPTQGKPCVEKDETQGQLKQKHLQSGTQTRRKERKCTQEKKRSPRSCSVVETAEHITSKSKRGTTTTHPKHRSLKQHVTATLNMSPQLRWEGTGPRNHCTPTQPRTHHTQQSNT